MGFCGLLFGEEFDDVRVYDELSNFSRGMSDAQGVFIEGVAFECGSILRAKAGEVRFNLGLKDVELQGSVFLELEFALLAVLALPLLFFFPFEFFLFFAFGTEAFGTGEFFGCLNRGTKEPRSVGDIRILLKKDVFEVVYLFFDEDGIVGRNKGSCNVWRKSVAY